MKSTKAAAKKTATKAVKKAATKKTVTKKVAVKKVAAKKVAVKATATKAVAKTAKKAAAKQPSLAQTIIVASVDVGFGNTLFLRGDGPGLSWSAGIPMDPSSDSKWSMTLAGVKESFEFKVLINDSYWSSGYNHTAKPGVTTEIEPEF